MPITEDNIGLKVKLFHKVSVSKTYEFVNPLAVINPSNVRILMKIDYAGAPRLQRAPLSSGFPHPYSVDALFNLIFFRATKFDLSSIVERAFGTIPWSKFKINVTVWELFLFSFQIR